ncbi:uncharacterized protein si:ch211-12e13.1 [Hippoglossus hippoglossus]|uniref:uncharacterized protein si:ch211-12e13.1 n=1 Tax=Hippoglossus hippoglossus TaxID=8267 RepID=UPI00148CCD3B|nr:uncharacterized protein si:ch211-12e13.1 [Hippoglossus hippoglossus]
MGNAQSCGVACLTVGSVYLLYAHIYRSHQLLKTNVLSSDHLPSFLYLYLRSLSRAVSRRSGHLHATPPKKRREAVFTVLQYRLDPVTLRRFCSAGGYGWDYPDTEYRDIPLCFPDFLCGRLLLMVLTDPSFRLSPAGLVRVRQSVKTLQPIDELKKGPFMLQVRVMEYRPIDAGVEVDICLSASSRSGSLVWESVLTLLSKNKLHTADTCFTKTEHESQPCEPVPDNMKQVELRVPWRTNLLCAWSSSIYSLHRLLSLPAGLFGCRSQSAPSLWMLSVCLAEIEKHKGVEVITAPINVTVQFREPLLVPGKVVIRFWEMTKKRGQHFAEGLSFHMQQPGSNISHVVGMISKS